MTTPIRWGILGPGGIARQFAAGLKALPDAVIHAVGSRSQKNADAFGDLYGIPRRHDSYESLASDPEVDIIYVATPHSGHYDAIRLCLEHGKPVLCEKPFTINAVQAKAAIDLARKEGLFLMEGMWTRFFPLMDRVRRMVREGAIGDVVMLQADFGFQAGFNPEGRLFNPALGGGALLDVGVYPLSLASMLFGAPKGIAALMHLGETNVDVQTGAVLAYEDQKIALIATSVLADTLQDAILTGTAGRIRIHSPWWKPSAMTISTSGKNERIEVPYEANGFNHEVAEVMRRLRAGKLESDIMPLDETLSIMEVMDEIRRQGRLVYPGE